jgi:DNA-binding response OmpR family regulator
MDASTQNTEPIRVLFVEDEFLISEWIAQSLSDQGFAVDVVTDAATALRRMANSSIDVLLTDINLPGAMDGALARRARELRPDLPVIYASARAALLRQEARVPGSLVLGKPYEPAVLGRLLAAIVRAAPAAVPA